MIPAAGLCREIKEGNKSGALPKHTVWVGGRDKWLKQWILWMVNWLWYLFREANMEMEIMGISRLSRRIPKTRNGPHKRERERSFPL